MIPHLFEKAALAIVDDAEAHLSETSTSAHMKGLTESVHKNKTSHAWMKGAKIKSGVWVVKY